jgi:hypothetical protein
MRENWWLVPEALRIARRTMTAVKINIGFTAIYNLTGLTLAALGLLPPTIAAAAQAGPDATVQYETATFDYGLILAPGITISSSTVTCAVVSGTDAASSSRLVGSAYNPRRCRLAPQTPRPRREKHVSRQHIEEKVTRRNRANSCRLFPTGADHEWSRRDLQKKSG